MNRREFTKSLGAVAALPALPLSATMTTAAPSYPMQSLRFMAIYLSTLQGRFTPEMVQRMTGCDSFQAAAITREFVADGVITAAQAAGRTVSTAGVPAAIRQIRPPHTPGLASLKQRVDQAAEVIDQICDEADDPIS